MQTKGSTSILSAFFDVHKEAQSGSGTAQEPTLAVFPSTGVRQMQHGAEPVPGRGKPTFQKAERGQDALQKSESWPTNRGALDTPPADGVATVVPRRACATALPAHREHPVTRLLSQT